MQILALHGFTGCGEDFADFAALCPAVDAWDCPNLPGHGPQPQLDCSPEATLHFIQSRASADKSHASTRRAILLGYSMGARAALLHACRYPEHWDALILISPNPGIEAATERVERRRVDERLACRIERGGVHAFIEFWKNTPMIRSQKTIRADWRTTMQAARRQHTAAGLAASLRQFGQGNFPNLWPELPQLSLPTLLICGASDEKYSRLAARMSTVLPNCSQYTIAAVGHMPQLEAPAASAAIINSFLSTRLG